MMGYYCIWVVWIIMMGLVGLCLYYCGSLITQERRRSRSIEKKRGVIPNGNLGLPFIGETLDFISSGYSSQPVRFMEKRKFMYGKVFKTNILGTPIIVSTDPEVNKVVLQNHGNAFVTAYPKSIRELFGENSILQLNGTKQRRLHALIIGFLRSPRFKSRITKNIETSVHLTLSSWKNMDRVLVQEETKKITFPVLVTSLMSIERGGVVDYLKEEFEEFIKGLICLPIKFPGTRLYKSLKAKEKMSKMIKKIAEERKMRIEKLSSNYGSDHDQVNDALEALLRDQESLPLDFICGNIIEMMIPGEETVPIAMTLAVKFLSDCPIALKQLTEENMELKRQKADSRDDYNWTDYMSLPFTQNVISETLRMANIINAIWRKALKDVEIKGYLIPQGWCVMTSFMSVHMDENIFENPYKFDPWRWEKRVAAVNNNCFTPFGGGQRLCPGLELSRLEISVFLHHLVTTYRWEAEKDDIVYFPTVKMKRKLPITVSNI